MRHGPVLHKRLRRDRCIQGGGEDTGDPGRAEGCWYFRLSLGGYRFVPPQYQLCSRYVKGLYMEGLLAEPLLRIGELARRAGISTATLRAWERRYGVIEPARGESGYRLYSRADERRLHDMVGLIATGVAPAEAARRLLAADPPVPAPAAADDPGIASGLREDLLAALLRFDETEADRLLDRAVSILSIEALLTDLILPVLQDLGRGWQVEEITVGQEHFASSVLRSRMLGLARGWGGGEGRLALLAAPAGEHHDLGLIAFGLALRSHGWRVAFLGADTPLESVISAAEELQPAVCVISVMDPDHLDGTELELARLGMVTALMLAGAGVPGELPSRIGATHMLDDPVLAAQGLAA